MNCLLPVNKKSVLRNRSVTRVHSSVLKASVTVIYIATHKEIDQ